FFFSSRRRHTRFSRDWSSDVCSSDLNPQAPVHVLIVPNEPIPTAADVKPEHEAALGRMFTVAAKVAAQEGLEKGYRLIVNCKERSEERRVGKGGRCGGAP